VANNLFMKIVLAHIQKYKILSFCE